MNDAKVSFVAQVNECRIYSNGRTVKGAEVTFGPFRAEARTAAEAKAIVQERATRWAEVSSAYYGPIVVSFNGQSTIVTLTATHEGPAAQKVTVRADGSSSHYVQDWTTITDLTDHARYMLAQETTDYADNDSVRRGMAYVEQNTTDGTGPRTLLEFVAWQRAWHAVPSDCVDAWQYAQDHRAEHVPCL